MDETHTQASRTALSVAAMRALHLARDGEPKILVDPVAAKLLGPELPVRTGDSDEARAIRMRVLLRSRFAEERLEQAVRRGVTQYVSLGAGFDTFAWRQPEWARSLRMFEVDHPATQAEKRRRLGSAGVALPPNLEFAGIDFETTSLADGLHASTLDFSQPAFFSCLGVLVYLTRDAVDAVFRLVAGFPKGSEIAFTFASPGSLASPTAQRAASAGEPWQSGFERDQLGRMLRAMGYASLVFLEREEAERYAGRRNDGLTVPTRSSIAAAVV